MECLQKPMNTGRMGTRIVKYDSEKITRIREKIKVVFGSVSTWDDATISERYNITSDGELIMILR
jgi:ABC-type histidine transport system ATPase subunit